MLLKVRKRDPIGSWFCVFVGIVLGRLVVRAESLTNWYLTIGVAVVVFECAVLWLRRRVLTAAKQMKSSAIAEQDAGVWRMAAYSAVGCAVLFIASALVDQTPLPYMLAAFTAMQSQWYLLHDTAADLVRQEGRIERNGRRGGMIMTGLGLGIILVSILLAPPMVQSLSGPFSARWRSLLRLGTGWGQFVAGPMFVLVGFMSQAAAAHRTVLGHLASPTSDPQETNC